jgi:speckle-type POZ protein
MEWYCHRLTVRCDFCILTKPSAAVPPKPDILRDLHGLLLSGEGTDVTFLVGVKRFAAHGCVLAAQSAVFRSQLFSPNTNKETAANSTVIHIDNMEAHVFELFLSFMYGESVPKIEEEEGEEDVITMWKQLLMAADRYRFSRLRLVCEQKLCAYIGVATVTTILSLAEQHRCRGLKDSCLEFLSNPANLQQVLADDGLDHLASSCPLVLKDLIARRASSLRLSSALLF